MQMNEKGLLMNQEQRRITMIHMLLNEREQFRNIDVPENEQEQRRLLRSLLNIRPASPAKEDFLKIQDTYLREEINRKGIVDIRDLVPFRNGLYLWQGDITTLRCDAIVNAANSGMTGCYQPCHNCIDNCIHTYAGIQLRNICAEIMDRQGSEEPVGRAKITPAYNLPCRYVIHTVGPTVEAELSAEKEMQLASCYRSCLELADENEVKSIAFCCISTGVFRFPNKRAAEIAVETVRWYKEKTNSEIEVIFNVWKDIDSAIYRDILGRD